MGISRKGGGHLTPIPKNRASENTGTKDRPFYWNSVKHSDYGSDTGAPVKSIKLSKEEIDKLYPKSKTSISQDELRSLIGEGMSIKEIAKKSGISRENLLMIAKGYGLSAKLYQNSMDEEI